MKEIFSRRNDLKTVVYQSYRTFNVPDWITKCMKTVKDWANKKGFDYEFIDDRLFSYVPDWYIKRTNKNILPISDLARLELAKEFLSKGYDRTIWVDADVVVFDADNFNIDITKQFAFCREVWMDRLPGGEVSYSLGINNAVTVFVKNNKILDFYIYACKSLVKNKPGNIDRLDVGTRFLSTLYPNVYFPLLTNVGLFSPIVMYAIAAGHKDYIRKYMKKFGSAIQAANLCSSLKERSFDGLVMNDKIYKAVINNLVSTKGSIINQL